MMSRDVLNLAWAFVVRSALTYASYRSKLLLGFASLILSAITFLFVGRVVELAGPGFEDEVGMTYTAFALIGVTVHGVAASGLHVFRKAVRREQLQGTLEQLVSSGRSVTLLVFLAGLSETIIGQGVTLGLAVIVLTVLDVTIPVTLTALAAVALYSLTVSGIGLISAGLIMVFKEGEPVSWAFGALSGLLGGVYFPVSLLPVWLRRAAWVFPTSHVLPVVRAGFRGPTQDVTATAITGAASIATHLTFLLVSAAVSVVIGLIVLRRACDHVRVTGTLREY